MPGPQASERDRSGSGHSSYSAGSRGEADLSRLPTGGALFADDDDDGEEPTTDGAAAVSYTHLTLPTIYSV